MDQIWLEPSKLKVHISRSFSGGEDSRKWLSRKTTFGLFKCNLAINLFKIIKTCLILVVVVSNIC